MLYISENELHNLQGSPLLCWPVYCHIRRLMDKETGLVGTRFPIALNSIADDCRVEEGQGKRNTGKPSISKIRTAIENLIKAGLLESRSIVTADQKKLIFFMPIAYASLCAQNKVHRNLTQKIHSKDSIGITEETLVNPISYENKIENVLPEHRTGGDTMFRTYKRINNNKNTHTDAREDFFSNEEKENFEQSREIKKTTPQIMDKDPAPDNFQPSSHLLTQAKSLGLSGVEDPKVLYEFLAHAKAHGLRYHDWDAAFLQWLIRGERLMNKQPRKKNHVRTNTPKTESLSLVDKIRLQQNTASQSNKVVFLDAHCATGHPNLMGEDDSSVWS